MNIVLCNGIYECIACRSQNKIPPHRHPNQHNQRRPKTRGKHQRTLKALKEEKKQAKKQLRALQRDGTRPEQVRALAQSFHSLVQRYNKLSREAQQAEKRRSRKVNVGPATRTSGSMLEAS